MIIELDRSGLQEQLKDLVLAATLEALEQNRKQLVTKQWMSLKEGCEYAGVSFNTFSKFRAMGLQVCEIDGIKRVSKKEIDSFLQSNSY